MVLTRERKLGLTVTAFALTVGLVAGASATHSVIPLFATWAPLLAVPWVLTRPEPGEATPPGPEPAPPGRGAREPPV